MIAQFISFYGHDVWFSPEYMTVDHIVPVHRFQLLYRAIPHVQAFQRISSTHSSFVAGVMLNVPDKNAITSLIDQEFDMSYGITKGRNGR